MGLCSPRRTEIDPKKKKKKETVLMSGTHYFKGSETRRGHGVEGG